MVDRTQHTVDTQTQGGFEAMLPFCCCSTARSFQKGIFLLLAMASVVECFRSVTAPQQQQHHLTVPNAIAIPHDSSSWLGRSSSRKNRIQNVLEKAQSRTGLANANSGMATLEKQVETTPKAASSSSIDKTLPFTLPELSSLQLEQLQGGEIIQEQSEMGRQGSGFVVQDVEANEESVWVCLLDFDGYTDNIHTVRKTKIIETTSSKRQYNIPSMTRASFSVSKFHLTISAVLQYHPHECGHYMELSLDNKISNAALQQAKGIWYTQVISPSVTRVWLLCDLTVSPLLPPFIVDCAATKAMPRASSWIRPTVAKRQESQS